MATVPVYAMLILGLVLGFALVTFCILYERRVGFGPQPKGPLSDVFRWTPRGFPRSHVGSASAAGVGVGRGGEVGGGRFGLPPDYKSSEDLESASDLSAYQNSLTHLKPPPTAQMR
ncbi:hypothetical protein BT69DRAFT_1347782 [Atractiella rhizophila]|nr:hypothetical protein BT69DRAFT_1347782 [Atractiella rhizophila]